MLCNIQNILSMDRGRIIQKRRLKFIEIAKDVFAAISPYRGVSWANAAFINRGDGLVYDTFFDLFHAQEMRDVFSELSGKEYPTYVVNSHYNSDHTWGNKVFEKSCIIMHKNAEVERLTEDINWYDALIKRGKDSMESTVGERYFAAQFEGFDLTGVEWVEPDIEISNDIEIRLGDTKVQVLNVAPSHSNSDLLLWIPRDEVLFAGDVVFNGCTAYSEAGIYNWVKVLDKIINEIKPKVIVPGHGAVCGVDFVQEQRDYLMNILDGVDQFYTDNISAVELSKKIDISKYLHWIQPERILSSVDAIIKGKRGQSPVPDWNSVPVQLEEVKKSLYQKYGDRIIKWDPMSSWNL